MKFHQTRVSVETVLPLYSTLKFGHPVKVCAFLRNRPNRLSRKRELASDINVAHHTLITSNLTWNVGLFQFNLRPVPDSTPNIITSHRHNLSHNLMSCNLKTGKQRTCQYLSTAFQNQGRRLNNTCNRWW
jgi:hypothetical protein